MDYPKTSPLITPALEEQLRPLLGKLTVPVELVCLVGTDAKSVEMAGFVNHFAGLSPLLQCRFLTPGQEPDTEALLDGSLLPATGVFKDGTFARMVFHGIPGGKEITAFLSALLNAAGCAKALDKPTLKDIGKIRKPLELRVCVSLGCQHCSQLVMHAHRIAWENPLVTAHMIDANLYPALVQQYGISRVPLTILNGTDTFSGGKTLAELTTLLSRI